MRHFQERGRECGAWHKAWYVGIYSVKKRPDTTLADGDRVEIYRPLPHDPMARRKAKSKKPNSNKGDSLS